MRVTLRRSFGLLCLLCLAAGYGWIDYSLRMSLRPAAQLSGLLLFVTLLLLTAFNARKKLPYLPLMKAATWLQFHAYAGYFSVVLFLVHIGFRMPSGGLEITVAVLYLLVSLSGVAGLALSRLLPPRLTVHGEALIFERIPGLRAKLRREVEELVLASVESTGSSTISDFYAEQLARYFSGPRNVGSHLFGSKKPLHQLVERIDALGRFLNPAELSVMGEIAARVRAKDNLDFQWHAQGVLKLWLFVHIPLTYGLLIFGAAHGMLAWKFT